MQCLECGFSTTKASNWQTHLASFRHLAITGHACVCEKIYKQKSHLRRHEKTCTVRLELDSRMASNCHATTLNCIVDRLAQEQSDRDERIAQEHVRHLREQSERDDRLAQQQAERDARIAQELSDRDARHAAELAALRAELAARPTTVVNNTNCTFNLAVFLNETCKNAQTIEQFMGGIPLRMDSDKSMGQFIIDSLNRCALEDRPIHCTDVKRGKLAVKHGDNVWEQDPAKVDPLVALNVNALRQRYIRHLSSVWCPENPDYLTDDKLNTEWVQCLSIACKDMDEKFLSHVAKATLIPK